MNLSVFPPSGQPKKKSPNMVYRRDGGQDVPWDMPISKHLVTGWTARNATAGPSLSLFLFLLTLRHKIRCQESVWGPKKWPLPMWSSRFSGKDMNQYLSKARNACHGNELKLITYKTARQRSMNTCAGPATQVEKQVVFVFVYQIDWLIMVDIPMIFGLTIHTVTTHFWWFTSQSFKHAKKN